MKKIYVERKRQFCTVNALVFISGLFVVNAAIIIASNANAVNANNNWPYIYLYVLCTYIYLLNVGVMSTLMHFKLRTVT